jgi:hypothetical protein
MVLTTTEAFKREMGGLRARAVYLATLRVGAKCVLAVENYANGAGDTVTLNQDGSLFTITEGVDFSRGSSNTQCATNIAAALGGLTAGAYSAQGSVWYVANSTRSIVTFQTSDATAWTQSTRYPPVPRDYNFVSGEIELFGYPPSIGRVKPVSREKNPLTKQSSISDIEITFKEDGVLRDIIKRSRIKGKKLTLKVGSPALAAGDFIPEGVFVVDDYSTEHGEITLKLQSAAQAIMRDKELGAVLNVWNGDWINKHPLFILQDILTQSGVPTEYYDSTTLDPTNATYNDIEHWNMTRTTLSGQPGQTMLSQSIVHEGRINDPVVAADLIDSLLPLLPGQFIADESGVCKFKRYDRNEAIVRTWAKDIFDPDPPESYLKNLYNQVDFALLGSITNGTAVIRSQDAVSAWVNSSMVASEKKYATYSHETPWLNGVGVLHSALPVVEGAGAEEPLVSTSTSFKVGAGGGFNGFAGARFDPGVGSPQASPVAGSELDNAQGRTAILKIQSLDGARRLPAVAGYEYIEVDLLVSSTTTNDLQADIGAFPSTVEFRIKTRGLYGSTTPTAWRAGATVIDVTQTIFIQNQILERWSNGCPVASGWTPLSEMDVQIGDFVSCEIPHYVNFDEDGLQSTAVWEVVGKEVHALGDTPGVHWRLAWVRDNVNQTSASIEVIQVSAELETNDDCTVYDDDGQVVTNDDGITVTIC